MSTDVSLIRDADLLAELARAPASGFGRDVMLRVLADSQAKRDAERTRMAKLPASKRRRVETAKALQALPPTSADLTHVHSVLAICGLPYERLPQGQRDYDRAQGNMSISVTAGRLADERGQYHLQPVPFGPKARLVLMHLCSEAIQQKSATIEIADTFTGFVRDMGFPDSGGKRGPLTAFKEQLNALAACSIRMSTWSPHGMRSKAFHPIEDIALWLANDPRQTSLWPSTVTFSPAMYQSLSRHALPLNKRVLRAFAGSARKLDVYAWLSWRMHNLATPLSLSWTALYEQFGGASAELRRFKQHFRDDIREILEVLDKLPLELTDKGLTIRPADPSALALPARKS